MKQIDGTVEVQGPGGWKRTLFGGLSLVLLLLLILVYVFPFYWMVTTSVKTFEEAIRFPPTFIPRTFDMINNYRAAWTMANFPHFARNSLVITLITLVGQLLVTIPAAYAFAKKEFKFKGFLFGFILFDMMIPGQVTFIPIYVFLSNIGWLDTLWALTVPFFISSFGIFFVTQAFKQVPNEVIDAARTDNATELQIILGIMVPMNKPVIVTISLFTVIGKWNDYFWTLILTTSSKVRTLPFAVKSLFALGDGINMWNISMAGNVLLVAPLLIIYIFANKQIKQAFVYGGIK